MTHRLYELVYVSSAVRPMAVDELDRLLEGARAHNHSVGVTGMLLYADGTFIQVLEGRQQAVETLFAHIRNDTRHAQVIIIHQGSLEKRNFSDWKMGFRYLDASSFERKAGFSDLLSEGSPAYHAFCDNPGKTHELLLSFRQCSTAVPTSGPHP